MKTKTFIVCGGLALAVIGFGGDVGRCRGADAGAAAIPGGRAASKVVLANPRSVAVDKAGNLYAVEVDTGKLYKITPDGVASVVGAGTILTPIGVTIGLDGAVYVADADNNAVYRVAADGAVTGLGKQTAEGTYSTPTSVAGDAAGNAYVTNNGANVILKVAKDGVVSVFAGKTGASGVADGTGGAARFGTPRGIAIDGKGNLYVADEGNSNIRKITPEGVVTTLAGAAGKAGSADGTGAAAQFAGPRGLTVTAEGTVYVADTDNNCIRKITPAGVVTTIGGQAGVGGMVDGPASAARFNEPRGVAVDSVGNVFVADSGNGVVREITVGGVVTTMTGH